MLAAMDHFDSAQHPWMHVEGLRRLMNAIKAGGGEARLVGGCVRDALLGRVVGEVDLAVNLTPDKVSKILNSAGLKVVPTGIDHGTVTAVADHKGYEITTLRSDVETDGRRAKVAFTDDWQTDAARRDFTFNALYADADGKIYDYFNGRDDLAANHVRFIGDARARIQEDVLRILRFFRFYAWFGKGNPNQDGLAACRDLANLIPQLSVERVWREVVKLLSAPNPLPAWILMKEQGILAYVLPEATDTERLKTLLETEKKYEVEPSPLLRLAALLPKDIKLAISMAQRLKFARKEADKLKTLLALPERLAGHLDPVPFRRALYEYGAEACYEAVLLLPDQNLDRALELAATWEKPIFPLQGGDMLKLGLMPGPEVGAILKSVEEWWIERDFKPSRAECLREAQQHKSKIG